MAWSRSTSRRQSGPGVHRITDLVEKPPREEAPSNLAIIGRYILTPDIFHALAATASDRTGEIQLTNGLRHLLNSRPIYACEVDRRPPRHRQQAGIPEGGRLLRAESSRFCGSFPEVPRDDIQPFDSFEVDAAEDVSLFAESVLAGVLSLAAASDFAVSLLADVPAAESFPSARSQ